MANKTLVYIGLGVVLLLLVGTFAMGRMNGKVLDENNSNPDLSAYRSEEVPEECRLPGYENDVSKWKEHLGHHENTLYCLDYYN